MSYKKSKNGSILANEFVLYVVMIFVMTITLIASQYLVSGAQKDNSQMAPNITYQYPSLFVKSFLYFPIPKEDIKDLELDENKNYFIKDLIYLGDDDAMEVVKSLKYSYIANLKLKNSLGYFSGFSALSIVESNLLYIDYEATKIPDLETYLDKNNYFFYFKGEDDKFRIVYFQSS